jgi:hypothetical protein
MRVTPVVPIAALAVALLSLHACTDRNPLAVEPGQDEYATTCAGSGGTIRQGIVSGKWSLRDSPHRAVDNVYVKGDLVIEAGSLVCFAAGAVIGWADTTQLSTLTAEGTATAPVVFTAARPGERWGGIGTGVDAFQSPHFFRIRLSHVVIEDADVGVAMAEGHSVQVDYGLVRRTAGPGIRATAVGLRNVVVDSACQAADPCTAVSAQSHGARMVLEGVEVKDSGGGGVDLGIAFSEVDLANVRIEGSRGIGLSIAWDYKGYQSEVRRAEQPITITGGQSYPASLPVAAAARLLPSLETQERWTGNAEDVVYVWGYGSIEDLVVGPHLAWVLAEYPAYITTRPTEGVRPSVGHLRMLPGARFSGGRVGRITAEGTAGDPVSLEGSSLELSGNPAAPSTIAHGRLDGVIVAAGETHAIVMTDVLAENGYLSLAAPASRLERVFVRGVVDAWHSDVQWAPTEAVRIAAADVLISNSEIAHSSSDGILVEVAAGVRVRDGNIRYNSGVGLRNVATEAVDARENWWGDPAGPEGPHGDGVAGAVGYEPFRTEPVVLGGPVPTVLTLTPSSAQIPVGDTARFSVVVLDETGTMLRSERVVWHSSDAGVAMADAAGLVTGVEPGEATMTAVAASDTTVRATAGVHVIPGAPLYDWTRYDLGRLGGWGGIWGSADEGILVAGYGVIHHFDGVAWHETEIDPQVKLSGISGSAPDDVWVIGYDHSLDPGFSVLLRYDGDSWQPVQPPADRLVFLSGIWVAARDRVFAWGSTDRGSRQVLWRYDGTAWEEELEADISRMWSRSRDDVFAGTSEGTLHFDGETWSLVGGPAWPIYWGTAAELFVLWEGGRFSRYDGSGWQTLPTLPTGTYWAMAGTSANSIFAAGADGAVAHYDGTHWWTMWLGTSEPNFPGLSIVGEVVYLVSPGEVHRGQPR